MYTSPGQPDSGPQPRPSCRASSSVTRAIKPTKTVPPIALTQGKHIVGDLCVSNMTVAGLRGVVDDASLVHDFQGSTDNPAMNGTLRHQDIDLELPSQRAQKKVDKDHGGYQAHGLRHAFLSAIVSTSGRIHGEQLRLLYPVPPSFGCRDCCRDSNEDLLLYLVLPGPGWVSACRLSGLLLPSEQQECVDAGHVHDIEILGQSAGCGGGEDRIGEEMETSTVRASLVKQGYARLTRVCRRDARQCRAGG